jgi:signal recognition particle subunit SRP19
MVSKGLDKFVLWPHYFDRALSRAQGRRVGADQAVKGPDAKWIEVAAKRLGLDPELEEKASHPSVPYEKSGRVLIARKGKPKQTWLHEVAAKMRESQDARHNA